MPQPPPQHLPDHPPGPPVRPSELVEHKGRTSFDVALGILFFIPVIGLLPAIITVLWAAINLCRESIRRNAAVWLALSLGAVLFQFAIAPLVDRIGGRASSMAKTAGCAMNLSNLAKAIAIYGEMKADQWPPNLDALFQDDSLSPKMLICPSNWGPPEVKEGEGTSYFYCAPRSNTTPDDEACVIACDTIPVHPANFNIFRDGGLRVVLLSDFSIHRLPEAEFQQELQKPQNRRFAEELAKAANMTPQERLTYIVPSPPANMEGHR